MTDRLDRLRNGGDNSSENGKSHNGNAKVVETTIDGFGRKGDPYAELNDGKILYISSKSSHIKQHIIPNQRVKVEVEHENQDNAFGVVTELISDHRQSKHDLILDVAELCDIDRQKLNSDGKGTLKSLSKDALYEIRKELIGTKRALQKNSERGDR